MNSLMLAAAVFIIDGDVDFAHFAKAKPVKRAVLAYLNDAPKGLKTFLSETGFRPLRDLNRIQVRMKQPINEDQPGEPLVTLNGRFKPQRIQSSWAKNKKTTSIKRVKLAGKTAYVGQTNAPMFAIDSPRRIYAGYQPLVKKALQGQLDPLRKLPPFLRESKAWFRFRTTSQARKLIMKQNQGSPLAEVHEMQVKGWLEGEVLKLKMRLRTRHPDAANGIKMMVNLGLLNSNHPSSMRLGRALKYRVQGSTLSIDFSMKVSHLMALRPPPPPPPGRGGPTIIKEKPKGGQGQRPPAQGLGNQPYNGMGPQGSGFGQGMVQPQQPDSPRP